MRTAAIIVSAGRGSRLATAAASSASGQVANPPKQYRLIAGHSILAMALRAFESHPAITDTIVVIHADDRKLYDKAVTTPAPAPVTRHDPVQGGADRQASVLAGLDALATAGVDRVLIHDAARPFVSADVISRVIAAIGPQHGAIAACPVVDTLKRVDPDKGHPTLTTVDREHLWRAQTPQGFPFSAILDAHRSVASSRNGGEAPLHTDDASIAESTGLQVVLVTGSEDNFKITTADDLRRAEALMMTRQDNAYRAAGYSSEQWETRIGSGFDIHRFTTGDHVWLGGVKIPHTATLDGHSDADVVLHALTDALLGAIGDGDIGQHFPPSDPQWKGASSIRFLQDAVARVRRRKGRIINVDMTVLAEAPKIGPHRPAMQAVIGAALGLSADRIGIKATTMETLGAIGRREGIAAMATASVALPLESAPVLPPQEAS